MKNLVWIGLFVLLFVLAVFSYPGHPGFILGWSANWVLTLGICLLSAILANFFIRDRLRKL